MLAGARLVVLAGLIAAAVASPAIACPPPPPFPPLPAAPAGTTAEDQAALQQAWVDAHATLRDQQEADWRLQGQRRLFEESEGVLLARIDRLEAREKLPPEEAYLQAMPRVFLRPVKWLKGSGSSAEFSLAYTGLTSCGATPGYEALTGKPGGVYLVYLEKGAALEQANVAHAIAVGNVRDAATLAALIAPPQ